MKRKGACIEASLFLLRDGKEQLAVTGERIGASSVHGEASLGLYAEPRSHFIAHTQENNNGRKENAFIL